jgi:hypothetical protein
MITGTPVAWMISSNATEVTIDFFLAQLRLRNPSVIPKKFMSDRDPGQMNSIQRRYYEAQLLLCWWHVLHAWQQHFVTTHYPELWEKLKYWIRISDEKEFNKCWQEIQSLAPGSFLEYLNTYWIPVRDLWSAIARKDFTVFEHSDTNMLAEAYVSFRTSYMLLIHALYLPDGIIS